MKANELRIGNWVRIKNYVDFDWERRPKECQVNMLDLNNYIRYHWNGSGEEYYYKLEDCEPIPLTEEWLLKFGFEKDIDDLYLELKHLLFVSYNDDEFVHIKNMALDTITSIKYVHQLQNLYFALTGEELTFKSE